MTSIDVVEDISPRAQFTALPAQAAFDYPFPIFNEADLVFYVGSNLQVLGTDYTVAGVGADNGGTITLTTPLAGGEVVTLYRATAIERVTDFQQNGPGFTAALNDELDRITIVQQELKSGIGRSLRLPVTASTTDAQQELSPISAWLGKFLRISAAGVLEAAELVASIVPLTQSLIGQLLNPQTEEEAAVSVDPVSYQYDVLHAFRYMTVAQITATKNRTGLVDVRAAMQNAVSVAQEIGGTVYCPAGSYLINRVAGGDTQFNGIHIPYTHVFAYDKHMSLRGDGSSTVFLAGDNNMTVFRLSDSRTKLSDFAIDANSKTGISGLSLIGSNTSNASLAEHIDWNITSGLDIVGCAEGIELEPPSAGGCYFNRFDRVRLYTNTRHIRFRDNAISGGANRNTFLACNINGGNTGVWIDGADTNQFIACTFEEVQTGVSPNASPTAVWINLQGTGLGLLSQDNNFIGCMFEDCTVDINTANRRVSIIGGNCGAVGTITAPNGIDMLIGGDEQYLMRSLQLGSANVTGLLLQPSAIGYQTQGQISTSSNQAGAYPFNGDGHLIIQSRQSNTHDITVRTGATSLERFRIDGNGHTSIISGDFSLGMDNGGEIVNGATITTTGVRTVRINPGSNVTGIILQSGTQPGQKVEVINEAGSFSATFAAFATSRVADGTGASIAANRAMMFTWNAASSAWYH